MVRATGKCPLQSGMTRKGREMMRERYWMKGMDLSESAKKGIGEQDDRGSNAGTREISLL